MNIRKITKGDEETFLNLSREFYTSDAVLAPIPEQSHKETFKELMRSEDYLLGYLFEENDQTVGYALLNKMFGHEAGGMIVWIEELYVRPGHQDQGFGTQFFNYLFEHVPAKRYRLETEPENEGAVRLYNRLGFSSLAYHQYYLDN